jgi:transposase
MWFVGIDIAKRHHEACVLDESGKTCGKPLRFANDQIGGQKLLTWLRPLIPDFSQARIGMEATGHYWLALYSFLKKNDLTACVINPIQTNSFRNLYIRQTKTDTKDAFIIAELLRFGRYTSTELAKEKLVALRQLCRYRFTLVDTISDFKRRVIGLLDMTFPEYEKLFSDVFGKASSELLMEYTTPEEILSIDTEALAEFLAERSRNQFGLDRARRIQDAAKNTFGISLAMDAFRFQLRSLLQQIRFAEEQLAELEKEIEKYLSALDSYLVTIPGIGSVLAASILAEIGDISRFATGAKLVAYTGIDPTVRQSGDFTGTHNRMSKRGSPYLRRAVWLAATSSRLHNQTLKEYYGQKIAQGKHPLTATGAVARKLVYIIHAVLRDQKPFDPTVNTRFLNLEA